MSRFFVFLWKINFIMPLTKKDEKKNFDNETRIKELDQERERLYQENRKIRYGKLDELIGKFFKTRKETGYLVLINPDYHCSAINRTENIREFYGIVLRSCLISPYSDETYFDFDELGKVEIVINPSYEDFYEEFLKEFEEITEEEFYKIIEEEYNKFGKRILKKERKNDNNTTIENTGKKDKINSGNSEAGRRDTDGTS